LLKLIEKLVPAGTLPNGATVSQCHRMFAWVSCTQLHYMLTLDPFAGTPSSILALSQAVQAQYSLAAWYNAAVTPS
jgi:hypothetical protein